MISTISSVLFVKKFQNLPFLSVQHFLSPNFLLLTEQLLSLYRWNYSLDSPRHLMACRLPRTVLPKSKDLHILVIILISQGCIYQIWNHQANSNENYFTNCLVRYSSTPSFSRYFLNSSRLASILFPELPLVDMLYSTVFT